MTTPNELTLTENPTIRFCRDQLGWEYLDAGQVAALRGGLNQVLLKDHLVEALVRIHGVPTETAESVYGELLALGDNKTWLERLRGSLSKKVPGEEAHRTIHLVDFDRLENNRFVVTNQLRVRGPGDKISIPDVVFYVNGVPLVVLEAKSSIGAQDVWSAVGDIEVYEREIPRLFASNLFNIATDGLRLRYAATGAPRTFWFVWRDPWPREAGDFDDGHELGLWALLEKRRLLDLLAHFVVFEKDTDTGGTVKKICRYQQYRAATKIVDRVMEGAHRRGLIWHTQGSGKSLTMVFATLKLKFHRGLASPALTNPNILVLTDRRDLDVQISRTFENCGLPNPEQASSIEDLRELITPGIKGRVVLSTIHKLQGSATALPDSASWIILTDEAHRTQEKDLGAFVKATFPEAIAFGFTGTPVKTNDLDTRRNFGVPGEAYLDKYSIDDAVRDGATVPIRYMSRMPFWQLDDAKLDVEFDQKFSKEPKELRDYLKARGVTRGDLTRFEKRIEIVAFDIWTHFKLNVRPDGFKAQVVCADRKACALYKKHLDRAIADDLRYQGRSEDEARAEATRMTAAVYTDAGKEDHKPGFELVREYQLDDAATRDAIEGFKKQGEDPRFLIVCDKLLTGFDAPLEQAMYLDKYVVEHNLLQAIARTNRRCGEHKRYGLVVDYVGVTKDLRKALSEYRQGDVAPAMADAKVGEEDLRKARATVFAFLKDVQWSGDPVEDSKAAVDAIGTEDVWFRFREAASEFLGAFAAVGSSPIRLELKDDALLIGAVVARGREMFEQAQDLDYKAYSEKIRGMLARHLEVTGLKTLLTLRRITDPAFWDDFDDERRQGDLETAALRKGAELKHTLTDRARRNPAQYATLSARIRELIAQLQRRQITAAMMLTEAERISEMAERLEVARQISGADRRLFDVLSILRKGGRPTKAEASTGEDTALYFTSKSRGRLIALFERWEHGRCEGKGASFELGDGAGAVMDLLERVVNAPTPAWVVEQEGCDPFAALAERVVGIVDQVAVAPVSARETLRDRVARFVLSVEPFMFKVLAMIDRERCEKIYAKAKKKGLVTAIATFQRGDRIPYDLHLTDEEFKGHEGWAERPSYANALKDVIATRHAVAHHATKIDFDTWTSGMAVILGVVQANVGALAETIGEAEAGIDEEEREASPFLSDDEGDELLELAEGIVELYSSEEKAPVNWQLQEGVRRELRRSVKRLLFRKNKESGQERFTRATREAIMGAIDEYAAEAFAR